VSAHAHGFVPGRSIATNAVPHVGKAVELKFDIKDCFPTIHFGRVRGLLLAFGYSYPLATTLAVLMTEAPRQPFEIGGALHYVPIGPRMCVQRRTNESGAVQRRNVEARPTAGWPRQRETARPTTDMRMSVRSVPQPQPFAASEAERQAAREANGWSD
jgi:hypothetical protein